MKERKVKTVSLLGDQKVLVVTLLKIKKKTCTQILEKTDLATVLFLAKLTRVLPLVLNSIIYQLNLFQGSQVSEMDKIMNNVSVQIQR